MRFVGTEPCAEPDKGFNEDCGGHSLVLSRTRVSMSVRTEPCADPDEGFKKVCGEPDKGFTEVCVDSLVLSRTWVSTRSFFFSAPFRVAQNKVSNGETALCCAGKVHQRGRWTKAP